MTTSNVEVQREVASCSALATSTGEPIHGTAAWARAWLLIENREPWPSHAVNDLLPGHLRTRIAEAGWNTQFVREFDDRHGQTWRVWFADATKQTAWMWECDDVDQQHQAVESLLSGAPLPAALVSEPFLLVCTNGKRDACCAVKGREILTGLAQNDADRYADRYADRRSAPVALESTHLGGHRFAGVVVSLPHSYQYRCESADHARLIVESARQGLIHSEGIRGHTAMQPPAQVAELAIRQMWNLWGIGDRLTLDCVIEGPGARVVAVVGDVHDRRTVVASLRLRTGEPRRESCVGEPKPLRYWELDDLSE